MSPSGREELRRTVVVRQAVLEHNDRLARELRDDFAARGLFAANIVSSPGSGKTTLLERTLADLRGRVRCAVIVGDMATDNDARRLRGNGAEVVQVETGDLCHLEASMVRRAADGLDLSGVRLLIIENVGNLVCPAAYDLGESLRVVLLSVTEGEDKPLKYPVMFRSAGAVVVTKTDIAEAVGFDRGAALTNLRRAAPQAQVMEVSARTGDGMDRWYEFLEERMRQAA